MCGGSEHGSAMGMCEHSWQGSGKGQAPLGQWHFPSQVRCCLLSGQRTDAPVHPYRQMHLFCLTIAFQVLESKRVLAVCLLFFFFPIFPLCSLLTMKAPAQFQFWKSASSGFPGLARSSLVSWMCYIARECLTWMKRGLFWSLVCGKKNQPTMLFKLGGKNPEPLKIITSTQLICNAQTFRLSLLAIVYNTILQMIFKQCCQLTGKNWILKKEMKGT